MRIEPSASRDPVAVLRRPGKNGFAPTFGANVFVTGGTGYLGRQLVPRLGERGHRVYVLARPGSEGRLPGACIPVVGDVFDPETYSARIPHGATLVHLVGTARPAPWKASTFREVDLGSVRAVLRAAMVAQVRHFVYVSVAHPAPVMHAYIAARVEAEALIQASGIAATILRPWYVLGPGHRWPLVLLPAYWLLERLPATRASAQRLGFVRLAQMVGALVFAIESPKRERSILEVPQIRRCG